MKQTVNENMFLDAFKAHNRLNQYSLMGFKTLFQYLEELEEDLGKEIELDVIAICCEYSEYEEEELIKQYEHLLNGNEESNLEKVASIDDQLSLVLPVCQGKYIVRDN